MKNTNASVFHVRRYAVFTLMLFCVLLTSPLPAAERTYTVRKGDSLTSVARKHGVPISDLARLNGLAPDAWLQTGQKLRLPDLANAKAVSTSEPTSELSSSVAKWIQATKVRPRRWKYIVIHHSATDEGSMHGMERYHRRVRRMENGLAYHFVIGNGKGMADGLIGGGNRWKQQLDGGHLASAKQNEYCIGICLVGNFENTRPTPRQMSSLRALIQALQNRCDLGPEAVKTHQQINVIHTRCPGKLFVWEPR